MSTPSFKLISFIICPYVQRAMIILNEKNISFDVEYIDLSAPPPWFYDISPLEKVPVLLVDEKPLFESMVICEYLDEITPGSLYPADAFERAKNRAWIEFGNDILDSTFTLLRTDDPKKVSHLTNTLSERFEVLEDVISDADYFNDSNFSMVDAVYAPIFRYHKLISSCTDYGIFNDAPKVKAWGDRLLERPAVIKSVSESYDKAVVNRFVKMNSIIGQALAAK